MMKHLLIIFGLLAFITPAHSQSAADDRIRQLIIQQSIASYPGTCACPYSTMRNGRRCGRRSAYSKPGEYSPLCFKRDVPQEMVEQFKQNLVNR